MTGPEDPPRPTLRSDPSPAHDPPRPRTTSDDTAKPSPRTPTVSWSQSLSSRNGASGTVARTAPFSPDRGCGDFPGVAVRPILGQEPLGAGPRAVQSSQCERSTPVGGWHTEPTTPRVQGTPLRQPPFRENSTMTRLEGRNPGPDGHRLTTVGQGPERRCAPMCRRGPT